MNNVVNIDALIRSTWIDCRQRAASDQATASERLRALAEPESVELRDIFGQSSGLYSIAVLAKAYGWRTILYIEVESALGPGRVKTIAEFAACQGRRFG